MKSKWTKHGMGTRTAALTLACAAFLAGHAGTAAGQSGGSPAGQSAGPASQSAGPADGAEVTWRRQTGGAVRSTPAVTPRTVFIGSGDGHLYALDRETGEELWRYEAGSPVVGSPALTRGGVVVTARDGSIHSVEPATGARRWHLSGSHPAPLPGGWDYWVPSPAVSGDRVVVASPGGLLRALDAASGRDLWSRDMGAPLRSTPAVAGDRVVLGDGAGFVHAVSLRDGRPLWRHETDGVAHSLEEWGYDRTVIQARPTIAAGRVYIGSRDGGLYALDLETGRRLWRVDYGSPWVVAAAAVGEGRVYVGSSDGLFVQAVDAATGTELWRADLGARVFAGPAYTAGALYVADHSGRVRGLDPATGDVRWSLRLARQIQSSPVLSGMSLFVGADDGGIYRLDAAPTPRRAVYWDPAWADRGVRPGGALLADYLTDAGYERLDGEGLAAWLEARAVDSAPGVVVFALDYLPPSVPPGNATEPGLLRRYLEAGGTAVWTGFPPWALVRDSTGRPVRIDYDLHRRALDLDLSAGGTGEYGATPTSAGRRAGLEGVRLSSAAVAPGPAVTPLAMDELGRVAAAVRSYGGAPGTGFVVLWGLGADARTLAQIRAVSDRVAMGAERQVVP